MAPSILPGTRGRGDGAIRAGVTLDRWRRAGPFGEQEAFQRPRFGRPVPPSKYRAEIPELARRSEPNAIQPVRAAHFADETDLSERRNAAVCSVRPRRPLPLIERHPVRFWASSQRRAGAGARPVADPALLLAGHRPSAPAVRTTQKSRPLDPHQDRSRGDVPRKFHENPTCARRRPSLGGGRIGNSAMASRFSRLGNKAFLRCSKRKTSTEALRDSRPSQPDRTPLPSKNPLRSKIIEPCCVVTAVLCRGCPRPSSWPPAAARQCPIVHCGRRRGGTRGRPFRHRTESKVSPSHRTIWV